MKIYYVYFRLIGNTKADYHCMLVDADSILEAKNKVRKILNRKFKEYVIQMVTEEYKELN